MLACVGPLVSALATRLTEGDAGTGAWRHTGEGHLVAPFHGERAQRTVRNGSSVFISKGAGRGVEQKARDASLHDRARHEVALGDPAAQHARGERRPGALLEQAEAIAGRRSAVLAQ